MSSISKNSGSSGSTPRAAKTQTSSIQKTKSSNKPVKNQSTQKAGDQATISKEKGKVGSVPDFGASFGSQLIKRGAEGDNVKKVQEMLNSQGAKLDVDGKFGQKTLDAVKKFQEKQHLKSDGIIGKDTMGKLQGSALETPSKPAEGARPGQPGEVAKPTEVTRPGEVAKPTQETRPGEVAKPTQETRPGEVAKPTEATRPGEVAKPTEATPTGKIDLPQGYESLEKLSGQLHSNDPRFNTTTPEGRSATALALAIGGTEMYGKGRTATDFFTGRGGTGNNMLGFAQFNQKYHASKTNTPEKYTRYLGNILHGDARMPNSKAGGNHVQALTEAVKSGKIKSGDDLRNFMKQRGFGGSNWQGIDDGWGRNPGLAQALVGFLKQS